MEFGIAACSDAIDVVHVNYSSACSFPLPLPRGCCEVGANMPIIEQTPERLILKSGSTTLTFDRRAGMATLQRKLLFWSLKPSQALLEDVTDVTIDAAVDRASGVEVCSAMLVLRTGAGWAFPCSDRKEAETNSDAIRTFLGSAATTQTHSL
jgi:hypothetical protein